MLARGKTPAEVVGGGCDGCCCYCDLYTLAEYAYRDRLTYPPAGLQYPRPNTPTPYTSIVPPPPTLAPHMVETDPPEVEEELKSLQHPHLHPRIPPDLAMAFLLSLDLLRPISHHPQTLRHSVLESRDALYEALEKHLIRHDCHRRSSSYGTPGIKLEEGEGEGVGMKEGGTPSLVSSASHPADLQMPHYQIDPSMRAPGGSLGGVENALKYRDLHTHLPILTHTHMPPPLPTPMSTHGPKHTTFHAPTPIPTPIFTPIPVSVPMSAPASAPVPSTTTTPAWIRYPYFRSQSDGRNHNGEGGGGGTEGGGGGQRDGTDEEELGAFWEFLDSELRPIQPMQSCPESLSIFSEHKEMARKYLILQQEIFNLRKSKSTLEEKLSQAEKLEQIGNQRYQDKIRELENKRENLRHTHSRLRQQLEQIRLRQEEQQQRQNQQEDGNDIGIGHNHHISPP